MNTKELNDVIKKYVIKTTSTDYAIMLSGEWGIGKTYYIKNCLRDVISDYHVVSLFGIENSNELYERILESIVPGYKWRTSITERFGSIVSLLGKNIKESLKNILTPTEKETEALKSFTIEKYSNLIVFDDLERVSHNANIGDILSEIHKFVDEYNIKVLVVCNESEIKDKENYSLFKEKTIRYTLKYSPKIEEVYNSFKGRTDSKEYQSFLNSHSEDVINLLKHAAKENLRTLDFIVSQFYEVFNYLNQKILFKKNEEAREHFTYKVFLYLIICSIEYKNGHSNELNRLECINSCSLSRQLKSYVNNSNLSENVDKKEDYDSYLERTYYCYENKIIILEEITSYVLTGYLDTHALYKNAESFESEFISIRGTESVQKLIRFANADYNDKAPTDLFQEIINNMIEGKYVLSHILYIYKYYLGLKRIGLFNIENSEEEFKKAIDKTNNSEYILENIGSDIIDSCLEETDRIKHKEMIQYAYEHINQIKNNNELDLAKKNEVKLHEILDSKQKNGEDLYHYLCDNKNLITLETIDPLLNKIAKSNTNKQYWFYQFLLTNLFSYGDDIRNKIEQIIQQSINDFGFGQIYFKDIIKKLEYDKTHIK